MVRDFRHTWAALLLAVVVSGLLLPGRADAAAYDAHTVVPSRGPANLNGPTDVASEGGEFFIADAENGRIAVYANGSLVREWDGSAGHGPELIVPTGIAISPVDHLVYVVDAGLNQVLVYQQDGLFVRSWGSYGSALGQLASPQDVEVDSSGKVWVCDSLNHRIQVFGPTGLVPRAIGSFGPGNGQLNQPLSSALYGGNVYVTDSLNLRVQVFNATTGAYVTQWGPTGTASPITSRYAKPSGIEIDGAGNVFVSDQTNNFVERCNTGGTVNATWTTGGLSGPRGIFFASGVLYMADANNDRVARLSVAASTWSAAWNEYGSSAVGSFTRPTAMAETPDGLLVADTANNRVQMLDASGSFTGSISTAGLQSLSAPGGVAYSNLTHEIYIADTGNDCIRVYDRFGTYLRTLGVPGAGPGQYADPRGLEVDGSGNLLVADTGNRRIQRIAVANGANIQTIGSGQLTSPRGIAFNPSTGYVYVIDTDVHSVKAFSADGVLRYGWGGYGMGAGQFILPGGIDVEASTGDVFVADTLNDRFQVFDAAGSPKGLYGEPGTFKNEYRRPSAILAGARDVVVGDTENHRVQLNDWDATPPTTTALGTFNTWVNTPVEVTLSSPGARRTMFQLNGGTENFYTGPFTVVLQGQTVLRFWSVDYAGNVETANIRYIKLDSQPPAGTMVLAGGASAVGTTSVSVDSDVADQLSPLTALKMSVDAGSGFGARIGYSSSVPVVLPGEGLISATVRYYDGLENMLSLQDQVLVDLTPPAVQIGRQPGSDSTSESVLVSVSAQDAITSVANRHLKVDQAVEQPYAAPVLVSAEGWHTVVGRAVDAVGHEATVSAQFLIDKTAPDVLFDGISQGQITTQPLSFTLSADDDFSAVESIRYSIDGAPEQRYEGRVTVAEQGGHALTYRAIDAVGNSSVPVSVDFIIDATAPVTGRSEVPAAWQSREVTFTLNATDAGGSGVDATYYSLNGGPTVAYANRVTVSQEGTTVVTYWTVDRAGNVEGPASAVTVRVDLTEPHTEIGGLPADWTNKDVTFELSGTDDGGSGLSRRYFTLNGGTPTEYATPVTVTQEGVTTVRYWSVDGAGNVEDAHVGQVWIDRTDLETFISTLPADWVRAPVGFALRVDDYGASGVRETKYRIDGGQECLYSPGETVTVQAEGESTVEYWSVDGAGNTEQPIKSAMIRIDRTVPSTVAEGDHSRWVNHDASVSLLAHDAGAGVATSYFSVNAGDPAVYEGPIQFADEGTHELKFWSVDRLGNSEETQTVQVLIDRKHQTTAVIPEPSTGWVNGDVRFTLSVADTGASDVDRIEYHMDGVGTIMSCANGQELVFDRSIDDTITFWSVDGAGNREPEQHRRIRVDKDHPTTSSDALDVYVGGASIALTPADDGSGVTETKWRADQGEWQYSMRVSVPTRGDHTVEYLSTDQAGNIEPTRTVRFSVVSAPVDRVSDDNRYSGSVRAARSTFNPSGGTAWSGTRDVVIVSGEDRAAADPLAAAGLCGVYRAPLFLISASSVDLSVKQAVSEIASSSEGTLTVHVVGGPVSVPDSRVREIVAAVPRGITVVVDRVIRTGDRYDTAAAISRRIAAELGESPSTVLVANGADPAKYFDALALSPISAKNRVPLLLVSADSVPAATATELARLRAAGPVRVVVGGGVRTVSESVRAQLGRLCGAEAQRWSGATRYETAIAIADHALADDLLGTERVGVAAMLPDALTGGAMVGLDEGVLLLTESTRLTPSTGAWLRAHASDIRDCSVFGGDRSVTPAVKAAIAYSVR